MVTVADPFQISILDIVPTSMGSVLDKVYQSGTTPANQVLLSCTSDTDEVTVSFEVEGGADGWQPTVTIEGVECTNLSQIATDLRRFEGSCDVVVPITKVLQAVTATQEVASVAFTRSLDRPAILSVQWDNQGTVNPGDVYPDTDAGWWGAARGQAAFANNNNMKVSGTCETNATHVYIKDAGATNGQGLQGPYAVDAGVFDSTTAAGLASVKAGSGNNSTAHLVVYAVWAGTDGDDFDSETDQTAETVILDNDAPVLGSDSYDYNLGAKPSPNALRDGGTCEVTCSASDYTDVEYECTEGSDLVPTSATTYQLDKVWTHNLAYQKWWDDTDGTNARLKAFKDTNGLDTTKTFIIGMEIDADFTVVYPGSQVCLGSEDAFIITGSAGASTNVTGVRFNSQSHSDAIRTAQGGIDTLSGGNWTMNETARASGIGGSFTPIAAYGYIEVYVGSWRTSREKRTDNTIQGDTDTVPTFANEAVDQYPSGQTALKANETARCRITHTNPDIYSPDYDYNDGATSDFTSGGIPSPTVYAEYKTVTLQNPGVYRVTGKNYYLTVTQVDYNGMDATESLLVQVADLAATITISVNGEGTDNVLRSRATGGDQTYTITATCNQQMNEVTIKRDNVHSPADDGDAIASPMAGGGPTVWTTSIAIGEEDQKNSGAADNYEFQPTGGTNYGLNIADFPTTVLTDPEYWVAGFEERVVYFDTQYQQVWPIGTMVSNRDNATKMDPIIWGGIIELEYTTSDSDDPTGRTFTTCDAGGTHDADGEYFRINDTNVSGLPPAEPPGTVMYVREDA